MLDQDQIDQLSGSTAYGNGDEKIGKVGQIYLDDHTGQPQWVTINTGLFGTNESFVPLKDVVFSDGELRVPYDKSTVKDAPSVAADGHITPQEEQELFRYYEGAWDSDQSDSSMQQAVKNRGNDTTGPSTDDAMTRSEEKVDVGTRTEEAGRARLRKYVVTENVTQTVPVQKERAVIEREPITDDNTDPAMDGPEISEDEHEVVLHEERPVVSKTAEPVERVRLGTETETTEETVSTDVRKEQVEADGDLQR